MITVEIKVSGDWIECNGYEIVQIYGRYHVNNNGGYFEDLESAIRFCMEQCQ